MADRVSIDSKDEAGNGNWQEDLRAIGPGEDVAEAPGPNLGLCFFA